ncbi:MAG: YggS family pyridoxal phosphate-dependent enzyme [Brevinematales bacterium]|nr:YggS family pyridoxal phosphate-dependent enzyme [Brevinematales bacterium]
MSIKENYQRIMEQIEDLKAKKHISYPITIVAVTKTFGPEVVKEAVEAGIHHIGENRVQEAEEKFSKLQDLSFTRHLIGSLQSNKINKALQWFDVIQSVESVSLAEGISKRLQRTLPIFVEVNTSFETSKHGARPDEALDLIAQIKELPNLFITGLMTVGPLTEDEKKIREAFRLLRKLRDDAQKWFSHPLQLSMGMSDDFLVAIEEGSTMVRLGRVLFGSRR